ncbi:MAG: hypothetical protein JWO06_2882 [Bacteroidota bacterium]|nr:hypothetical protein [Bacteroidota bacterium]
MKKLHPLQLRSISGLPGLQKRCFTILVLALSCFSGLKAQVTAIPQRFNYTTQVTDSVGTPIGNTMINMRATLHSGSPTGIVVYSETDSALTSPAGIFTVVVGGGTIITGNFNNVPWTGGNIYFQVEMDVTGGTNFINMGNAQLISQPYSLISGNGVGAVSFDSTGRTVVNTANGLTALNSSKGAWMTTGNAGMGSINGYLGTADATDLILKRNNTEGLRLGAGKVSVAGNLGIGLVTPLTALDVSGAISLRDTTIYVASNFTINVGNHSLVIINSSNSPSHVACTLSNGLVVGQLLMIVVNKYGSSGGSGVYFVPNSSTNMRMTNNSSASLTDGSTISFIWNGVDWLETAVSIN